MLAEVLLRCKRRGPMRWEHTHLELLQIVAILPDVHPSRQARDELIHATHGGGATMPTRRQDKTSVCIKEGDGTMRSIRLSPLGDTPFAFLFLRQKTEVYRAHGEISARATSLYLSARPFLPMMPVRRRR